MRISKVTLIIVLVAFLVMTGMALWGVAVANHLTVIDEQQRVIIEMQDKFIREQAAAMKRINEMPQGPY